jgi:hypothetical protein
MLPVGVKKSPGGFGGVALGADETVEGARGAVGELMTFLGIKMN